MGRIEFYHTVWRKNPISGLVEPLEEIANSVYEVDELGVENEEAVVFSSRTGVSAPASMLTNDDGEIFFWLDNGDYNVHMEDTHVPARIADKIIGVSSVPGGPAQIARWQLPISELALVEVGVIEIFAGTVAPAGYLICHGQAVSRDTYADLYNVIGTAFGAGDGGSTFNMPDLQGRLPLGADPDDLRTTANNNIGLSGGEELHTQLVEELAEHSHDDGTLEGAAGGSHDHGGTTSGELSSLAHVHGFPREAASRVGGTGWQPLTINIFDPAFNAVGNFKVPMSQGPAAILDLLEANAGGAGPHGHAIAPATDSAHTVNGETGVVGASTPMNNMPPTQCINFIVKF